MHSSRGDAERYGCNPHLLRDHGVDINAANDAGEKTAVYAAIGSPALIRYLADHGAESWT